MRGRSLWQSRGQLPCENLDLNMPRMTGFLLHMLGDVLQTQMHEHMPNDFGYTTATTMLDTF